MTPLPLPLEKIKTEIDYCFVWLPQSHQRVSCFDLYMVLQSHHLDQQQHRACKCLGWSCDCIFTIFTCYCMFLHFFFIFPFWSFLPILFTKLTKVNFLQLEKNNLQKVCNTTNINITNKVCL